MFQTEQIEKIETYILWSIIFFFENRAVYEMWENMVQPDKTTIQYGAQNIRFAYRVTKARIKTHTPNTNTYSC